MTKSIAGFAVSAILLVSGSALATETKTTKTDICSQIRTKDECNATQGCKILEHTDGKSYCIRDARDYPPFKGGYPLD